MENQVGETAEQDKKSRQRVSGVGFRFPKGGYQPKKTSATLYNSRSTVFSSFVASSISIAIIS
jgi:hypothetical protein